MDGKIQGFIPPAILTLDPSSTSDLERERIALLRELKKLHPNEYFSSDRQTQKLHDIYNRIIDELDASKHSVLPDPLEVLPREIWENIVMEYIHSYQPRLSLIVDKLLFLTLISNQWQRFILSTTKFWVYIQILTDTEDLNAKIATCIQLSGQRLLEVAINLDLRIRNVDYSVIAANSHRIRRLDIAIYSSFHNDCELLQSVLLPFSDLPALDTLQVWPEEDMLFSDSALASVFGHARSIRSFRGVRVSNETLALPAFQKIQELTVTGFLEDRIKVLQNLQDLRHVYFSGSWVNSHQDKRDGSRKPRSNRRSAPHLRWSTLQIRFADFGDILSQAYSSISRLCVNQLRWTTIFSFLEICIEMPQLTDLEARIILDPRNDVIFSPPHQTNAIESLHTLVIHFISSYDLRKEQSNPASRNADGLFQALESPAPNVRNLNVVGQADLHFAYRYAGTLRRLEKLTAYGRVREETQYPAVMMGVVRDVAINSSPQFISCPLATRLNLERGNWEHSVNLAPENWTNLRTLRVRPTSRLDWDNMALVNLETVRLSSSHRKVGGSAFLSKVAASPSSFPSLKEVNLRCSPQWDLLLIALESRIIATEKNISIISKVIVPRLPTTAILYPLVQRLKGRLSSRPSNRDISLNEVASNYFQRCMPGCLHCHMYFLPCQHMSRTKGEATESQLPTYGYTVEEVLSSCVSQEQKWNDITKNTFNFYCRQAGSIISSEEITGSTLANITDGHVFF